MSTGRDRHFARMIRKIAARVKVNKGPPHTNLNSVFHQQVHQLSDLTAAKSKKKKKVSYAAFIINGLISSTIDHKYLKVYLVF